MEAETLLTQRRSVRNYSDEKVSRETMVEILEMARWAPSWANTQIARYTIVQNEDLLARIAEEGLCGFVYNKNTLIKAKGVVVLSFVKGKSGKLSAAKACEEATDFGNIWESFDAGIACQTFCLAAHAKGVGTCIFGVIDQQALKEIVNLPEGETVAALITFGYPSAQAQTPSRLEVEEISRFV